MKKIIVLSSPDMGYLIVFMLILLTADVAISAEADWTYIVLDRDRGIRHYVDMNSVKEISTFDIKGSFFEEGRPVISYLHKMQFEGEVIIAGKKIWKVVEKIIDLCGSGKQLILDVKAVAKQEAFGKPGEVIEQQTSEGHLSTPTGALGTIHNYMCITFAR